MKPNESVPNWMLKMSKNNSFRWMMDELNLMFVELEISWGIWISMKSAEWTI